MNPLKRLWRKAKEVLSISVVNDISDLYPIDESCRAFIDQYLPLWRRVYEGDPPWLKDCKAEDRRTLNAAKIVSEFLAGYNTAELEIGVSEEGSQADAFIKQTLQDNAFLYNLTIKDELKEAMGGLFMKPYNDDRRIVIDFVAPSSFYPISWDNRRFREGVFVSEYTDGDDVYTRLEAHLIESDGANSRVVIENRLFRREKHSKDLGVEVELTALRQTENLAPIATFEREEPLFVYLYPNKANNLDIDSPVRISRYANALTALESIDRAFMDWQKDRNRSRKMTIVPAMWMRRTVDEKTGRSRAEYDQDTDVFQMVDYHPNEKQTPVIVDPDYKPAQWAVDMSIGLGLLCLHTGLSADSIAFDSASGGIRAVTKTATEIRSENGDTFRTVTKNQEILREGIEELIEIILYLASRPEFGLIQVPAEGFEIKVEFDDSITPDRETYINEGLKLIESKVISRYTMLTQYLGYTEDDAKGEIDRMNAEADATRVPDPFMSGFEGIDSV